MGLLVRLFPSSSPTDIDDLQRARQKEFTRLVGRDDSNQQENDNDHMKIEDGKGKIENKKNDSDDDKDNDENSEDGDDESDNEDGNVCHCSEVKPCPIPGLNFGPICLSGFTPLQMMSLQACYIPMVQPDYSCQNIHLLALLGTDREKELLGKLRSDPHCANARDSAGNTALMLACAARQPSLSLVQTLLSEFPAVDVNAENEDGLTALHFAVLNKQAGIVSKLLKEKADVNAGCVEWEGKYYGLTPVLISLISSRDVQTLEILLHCNPNLSVETVKSVDNEANQLHFFLECECGGSFSKCTTTGRNVLPPSKVITGRWTRTGNELYHAVRCNGKHTLKLLLDKLEKMNKIEKALEESTCHGSFRIFSVAMFHLFPECMKEFLRCRPSEVNRPVASVTDFTPLNVLMYLNRFFKRRITCIECSKYVPVKESRVIEVISIIVNSPEVDVNVRTLQSQKTPLMLAAKNGHDYVMHRLLELGADPTAEDVHGNTALLLALDLKPRVCLKVLRILFTTGISHTIYKQSFNDSVILKKVCDTRNVRILDLFRRAGALSNFNRLAMLHSAQTATVDDANKDETEKKKEKFVQRLSVSMLWSLKQQLVMDLSASLGVGSPQRRAEVLTMKLREWIESDAARNEKVKRLLRSVKQEAKRLLKWALRGQRVKKKPEVCYRKKVKRSLKRRASISSSNSSSVGSQQKRAKAPRRMIHERKVKMSLKRRASISSSNSTSVGSQQKRAKVPRRMIRERKVKMSLKRRASISSSNSSSVGSQQKRVKAPRRMIHERKVKMSLKRRASINSSNSNSVGSQQKRAKPPRRMIHERKVKMFLKRRASTTLSDRVRVGSLQKHAEHCPSMAERKSEEGSSSSSHHGGEGENRVFIVKGRRVPGRHLKKEQRVSLAGLYQLVSNLLGEFPFWSREQNQKKERKKN